jgi:hypothetical protein
MKKITVWYTHRFGPLLVMAMLVCSLSFFTRIFLLIKSWGNIDFNLLHLIALFFIGFFYDVVVSTFFAVPLALYCWLMKNSWYQAKWSRVLLFTLFSIIVFILVANAGAEIVFWDEFNVRYNFIAVDYLIYTTEVLENIWESYNIPLILGLVFIVTIIILYFSSKKIILSWLVCALKREA